jgi:hypothetical protein
VRFPSCTACTSLHVFICRRHLHCVCTLQPVATNRGSLGPPVKHVAVGSDCLQRVLPGNDQVNDLDRQVEPQFCVLYRIWLEAIANFFLSL